MRHRVDYRKLGRTAAHRRAMLSNMVTSLFAKERITTTDAKAKEARRLAERLITRARKGYTAHQEGMSLKESGKDEEAQRMEAAALAHWRQAGRYIRKTEVLKKLFEEIAPHFLDRDGGYTRIVKMDRRPGDNARTVMLELVDTEITSKPVVEKRGGEEGESGTVEAAEEAPKKSKKKDKKDKEDKAETKSKSKGKAKAKSKTKSKAKAKTKSKAKAKSKADDKPKKGKKKDDE